MPESQQQTGDPFIYWRTCLRTVLIAELLVWLLLVITGPVSLVLLLATSVITGVVAFAAGLWGAIFRYEWSGQLRISSTCIVISEIVSISGWIALGSWLEQGLTGFALCLGVVCGLYFGWFLMPVILQLTWEWLQPRLGPLRSRLTDPPDGHEQLD